MGWLSDHVNLIGFIGAVVILIATVITAWNLIKKMKTDSADGVLTTHEWDGIREFSNNIPTGALLTILVLICWALWYVLIGYPLSSYSQIGEYNEETKAYNARFETIHANLDEAGLREMGEQIFMVQCAQCHGLTAEGNDGKAQNLTHWGKVDGVIDTIKHGSAGLYLANLDTNEMMMSEGLLTEEKDIQAVAQYVMAEIVGDKSRSYDAELVAHGKELFNGDGTCFTCHGENGQWTQESPAPNLALYGKKEFLENVLKHGKKGNIGVMPNFEYLNLSDKEYEALQVFIAAKKKID